MLFCVHIFLFFVFIGKYLSIKFLNSNLRIQKPFFNLFIFFSVYFSRFAFISSNMLDLDSSLYL